MRHLNIRQVCKIQHINCDKLGEIPQKLSENVIVLLGSILNET
jgi:hypothetical protein